MFNLFNKKDNIETNEVSDEKENNIKVSNQDGLLKIEILSSMSLLDYLESSGKVGLANMPMSMLFTEGYNYLASTLIPQTIYVYKDENKTYYVTDAGNNYKIIEYIRGEDHVDEILLEINKKENTFRIVKSLHDLSMSTIRCVSYPCEEDHMQEFALDRLEAFTSLKELIERIGKIHELDKIANVYDLYKYTNIRDEKYFNPIISDEGISISKIFLDNDYDINKVRDEFFDIILNDTKEIIGELTFTLYENNFIYPDKTIRYEGNVSYRIKPKYQSNHYATRALKLLVELIKKNTCSTDKDLYISTLPDNTNSQKVALNNGATLFYEGEVPESETLNYHDGVKAVKIYKITI